MNEIIIIGAGPAGLSAAYKLCQNGYKPIVIEATSYTGGISRTHKYKEHYIDLGGHRFFTRDKEVLDFWKEIMPLQGAPAKDDIICQRHIEKTDGPNPEKEDNVLLKRQRISRIFFKKKFFDYPVAANINTFKNFGLKLTFQIAFDYLKALIFKREEKSLEDFYINRFGKTLYSIFFEEYTQKLWGIHPNKISPTWGAQRVKEVSVLNVIKNSIASLFGFRKNTEAGQVDSFLYPKYGPGQMYEILAKKIIQQGGKIIYNNAVKEIKAENGKITELKTLSGETFISPTAVFSTMPIKDFVNSIDKEKLKPEILKIAQGLPYRDYSCVVLLVPMLKIKNKTNIKTVDNIIPDTWIYIQETGIKAGRIQIYNNWSPYLVGTDGVLIALEYFMQENDEYWNMPDENFIEMAKIEAEKMGFISAEQVKEAIRVKVKKAYPAYSGTYNNFGILRQYLDSIDNLYCLGRNGQHRYNNMDHSILTAFEAVKLFIHSKENNKKADKTSLWAINTKQEYHEK